MFGHGAALVAHAHGGVGPPSGLSRARRHAPHSWLHACVLVDASMPSGSPTSEARASPLPRQCSLRAAHSACSWPAFASRGFAYLTLCGLHHTHVGSFSRAQATSCPVDRGAPCKGCACLSVHCCATPPGGAPQTMAPCCMHAGHAQLYWHCRALRARHSLVYSSLGNRQIPEQRPTYYQR